MSRKYDLLLPLVISLMATMGCANNPIAGAAAMRIDVDVYKGPLSQEPETQWGGILGYLEEARRTLLENTNFILAVVQSRGFAAPEPDKGGAYFTSTPLDVLLEDHSASAQPPQNEADYYAYTPIDDTHKRGGDPISWCDKLDAEGLLDELRHLDCLTLRTLYLDSLDALKEVDEILEDYVKPLHPKNQPNNGFVPKKPIEMLIEVAELSNEFRAKAYRWSVSTAAGQSHEPDVRVAVIGFVMILSEFGNQLQARADALLKQHDSRSPNRDARELPLSTYLRESSPTEFLHLYNWLDASDDGSAWYRLMKHLSPGTPSMQVEDRIKVIQRLYSDHFWSRINSVHASGRGRVNMVFVKDEIGNWNLKNFENLPGELLDGYFKVGQSLLKSAASLAADAGSGGNTTAVKELLQTAKETIGRKNDSAAVTARAQLQSAEQEFLSNLQGVRTTLAQTTAPAVLSPQSALTKAESLATTFLDKIDLIQRAYVASQKDTGSVSSAISSLGEKAPALR